MTESEPSIEKTDDTIWKLSILAIAAEKSPPRSM